ncbi:MAG: hypothetical protein WD768_10550 [Phycisphaeraceae bacterium]
MSTRSIFSISAGLLILLFIITACQTKPAPLSNDPAKPAIPVHTDTHKVHNLHQLSGRVYSGSQPEGDVAFKELADLGVKTIITVDGATPDLERAKAHGMRYIHVPIGYDKVPDDKALLLAQAMKQTEGKVFVHCHHGKHRGPAAAAVCVITDEGWSNERATAWLKQVGTGSEYPGLYKSVADFKTPAPAVLSQKVTLPEKSPIPAMAGAMVIVGERWEHLGASQKVKFIVPPNSPDIDPPHEAMQLAELYREMARTKEAAAKGEDFLARLKQAEDEAANLSAAIKTLKSDPSDASLKLAEDAYTLAGKSCKSCHVRYRN